VDVLADELVELLELLDVLRLLDEPLLALVVDCDCNAVEDDVLDVLAELVARPTDDELLFVDELLELVWLLELRFSVNTPGRQRR